MSDDFCFVFFFTNNKYMLWNIVMKYINRKKQNGKMHTNVTKKKNNNYMTVETSLNSFLNGGVVYILGRNIGWILSQSRYAITPADHSDKVFLKNIFYFLFIFYHFKRFSKYKRNKITNIWNGSIFFLFVLSVINKSTAFI